ncbi:MAG: universal stress protein UspE [Syntrophus sp. PtaU1.Bin208]|nr:MAG: universal stress protein UspE [Syntrophus sp. PtaU1.Bin208]
MKAPPRRILLATDLSARSDRAQDRALLLAKHYNAELLVLHVLEQTQRNRPVHRVRFSPFFNPDEKLIESAKWQVLESLRDIGDRVKVRIEKGDPRHAILRIAGEERCDLIVTGVARNEMLGRITAGKTVDHLMRNAEISMLTVTDRVRGFYRNIVVTSDFSDASRLALETAATFFPKQKLTILHAHATPGSWAVDDRESYRAQMRQSVHQNYQSFLDTVDLNDDERARLTVLIDWGDISHLVQELVHSTSTDLVVLGSTIRNVLFKALIGSAAKRIMSVLPCDALVVRGRRSQDNGELALLTDGL